MITKPLHSRKQQHLQPFPPPKILCVMSCTANTDRGWCAGDRVVRRVVLPTPKRLLANRGCLLLQTAAYDCWGCNRGTSLSPYHPSFPLHAAISSGVAQHPTKFSAKRINLLPQPPSPNTNPPNETDKKKTPGIYAHPAFDKPSCADADAYSNACPSPAPNSTGWIFDI
ncbi:hypothetical protein BC567DRAFT_12752 [Phyllosticta citribraziliensis]